MIQECSVATQPLIKAPEKELGTISINGNEFISFHVTPNMLLHNIYPIVTRRFSRILVDTQLDETGRTTEE